MAPTWDTSKMQVQANYAVVVPVGVQAQADGLSSTAFRIDVYVISPPRWKQKSTKTSLKINPQQRGKTYNLLHRCFIEFNSLGCHFGASRLDGKQKSKNLTVCFWKDSSIHVGIAFGSFLHWFFAQNPFEIAPKSLSKNDKILNHCLSISSDFDLWKSLPRQR